jgi:hypothetical protein
MACVDPEGVALAKKLVPPPFVMVFPEAVKTVAVVTEEAQLNAPLTIAHLPLLDARVKPEPVYVLAVAGTRYRVAVSSYHLRQL